VFYSYAGQILFWFRLYTASASPRDWIRKDFSMDSSTTAAKHTMRAGSVPLETDSLVRMSSSSSAHAASEPFLPSWHKDTTAQADIVGSALLPVRPSTSSSGDEKDSWLAM
jgi:hypothetical protein